MRVPLREAESANRPGCGGTGVCYWTEILLCMASLTVL